MADYILLAALLVLWAGLIWSDCVTPRTFVRRDDLFDVGEPIDEAIVWGGDPVGECEHNTVPPRDLVVKS